MTSITTAVMEALVSLSIMSYPEGISQRQFNCLVEAVHFESRGEVRRGKIATINVVENRVSNPQWRDTHCSVVHQPAQFSFTSEPNYKRYNYARMNSTDRASFEESVMFVWMSVEYGLKDLTGGATHFAAPWVNNAWTRKFRQTARIGGHVYYKSNG